MERKTFLHFHDEVFSVYYIVDSDGFWWTMRSELTVEIPRQQWLRESAT